MSFATLKDLHDFASSYWHVCVLHSAIKLQIFTHLGSARLPAEQVAQRIPADERATGLLLDALSSLGLLIKEQEGYANTPLSRQYLNENSADFSGHIVHHYIHMYHDWGRLDEAVRSGGPPRASAARTEASTHHFLLGMRDLAVRGAQELVRHLDLDAAETLLDLGGGPATYSLHFCQRYPHLYATIFDFPGSEIVAWEQIKSFGLESRFRFIGGDFLRDPLPPGPFDVVFMSQILHSNDYDQCGSLLKRVYPIVKPGGRVIIQEFVLNESKTFPPFAAVFSLNMLLHTSGGRSYAITEINGWLEEAGFVKILQEFPDLPNDASLVVAHRPTAPPD